MIIQAVGKATIVTQKKIVMLVRGQKYSRSVAVVAFWGRDNGQEAWLYKCNLRKSVRNTITTICGEEEKKNLIVCVVYAENIAGALLFWRFTTGKRRGHK